MKPLYQLVDDQAELYELLSDASYIDGDGVINPELITLLERGKRDIKQKAIGVALVQKQLAAEAELIKAEAKKLTERSRQAEKNAEYLKEYLARNLKQAEIKEVKDDPRVVITFRKSERVEVDMTMLDAAYYKAPPPPEPDKTAIKRDIKAGTAINGAWLVDEQNIQIK
jgi:hypothetical protein